MSVDTVSIHHTDHPQILNACKILLIEIGILINLSHLRDESCSCLVGNSFNDLMIRTPCLVLNLDWFIIGSSLHRHCLLVLSYVDTSEVWRLVLIVKHANLVRISLWTAAVGQLSGPLIVFNISILFIWSSMVVPASFLLAAITWVQYVFKVHSVRYSRLARVLIDLDWSRRWRFVLCTPCSIVACLIGICEWNNYRMRSTVLILVRLKNIELGYLVYLRCASSQVLCVCDHGLRHR